MLRLFFGNATAKYSRSRRSREPKKAKRTRMDEVLVWYSERGEAPPGGLRTACIEDGFRLFPCEDLNEFRLKLQSGEAAVLVVELADPASWTAWPLVEEWRGSVRFFPVLVLTERTGPEAVVQALEAGANDCMATPADLEELLARSRNLIHLVWRRRGGVPLTLDGLRLEPKRGRAYRDGIDLELTPKEFALLYYLVSNAGDTCSRGEILREVWGYDFHTATNVVDVYIRHVRVKVDKGRRRKLIHTVRGIGYVVRAPEEAPQT